MVARYVIPNRIPAEKNDIQKDTIFVGRESTRRRLSSALEESNGCAERVIRFSKENPLRLKTRSGIEELQPDIQWFEDVYDEQRPVERHGHRSNPSRFIRDETGGIPIAA